MTPFTKTSVVCLCCLLAFLFAWQYLADPRGRAGSPAPVLGQIARTIFGERCRETYRIDRRTDAIAYAREIWKSERLKLAILELEPAILFASGLFRGEGDKDRKFSSNGWLVSHSRFDGWRASYSVSDPAVALYLAAEFTDCGRATNSASKIFKLR
jgi:hypothetical protein